MHSLTTIVRIKPTHMQVTLHFFRLRSTPGLLQKGTSQLAHRHPSAELGGIESRRVMGDDRPPPTQHAGRVRATLPGGGGSEGKQVRMQEWGMQGEEHSQRKKAHCYTFSTNIAKSECTAAMAKGVMMCIFSLRAKSWPTTV